MDQTIIDSSSAETYRKSRQWQSVYNLIPNFSLYPGIQEVFDYIISKKIPSCIVTSSISNYCEKVISHWDLPFQSFVCYHDTKLQKPNPEPILLALRKMGVTASDAFSFGDSAVDILASHRAGIKAAACLWGTKELENLIGTSPDYLLSHPKDIITILSAHLQ